MSLILKRERMISKCIISRLHKFLIFYIIIWTLLSCANINLERPYDTKIIAHRGFWDNIGSTQNSITSMLNAKELGVAGIEFDVTVTADDSLVVIHGPYHGDMLIAETEFDELRSLLLENGEVVPSLREYLYVLRSYPDLVVFIDLKDTYHIHEIYSMVSSTITNPCYYLSFSMPVCRAICEFSSSNNVLYLGNNYSPQELADYGLAGASYPKETLLDKPEYLIELKTLGLISSVWTVNGNEELTMWLGLPNVDFITTDTPGLIDLNH